MTDGSLPRPTDPGPTAPSPTVRPATRQRLERAEQRRVATLAATEPGHHLRTTLAFGLAAAALAAVWRLIGGTFGDRHDE